MELDGETLTLTFIHRFSDSSKINNFKYKNKKLMKSLLQKLVDVETTLMP